MLGDL